MLLDVLRKIERRGAVETAHRARSLASQVFRYAIATGRAERDPSIDLRGALSPRTSSISPASPSLLRLHNCCVRFMATGNRPRGRAQIRPSRLCTARRIAQRTLDNIDPRHGRMAIFGQQDRADPILCRYRPKPSQSCGSFTH